MSNCAIQFNRSRLRWAAWLALLPLTGRPLTLSEADPPQILFKDLFVAVQTAQVFADSKVFPDAVPTASPTEILKLFSAQRPQSTAALKEFVTAHFTLPAATVAGAIGAASSSLSIVAHIDNLWEPLTRSTSTAAPFSSQLTLPHPYIVPGGRFREIYYWDSYFTMLGLAESGRHDLVNGMVRDFAYLIDRIGHIPNGTRTYYLSRSQPPFFFAMVGLLAPEDPAAAFAQFLPQLRQEYAFWMQGSQGLYPGTAHRRVVAMPDGSTLNRFWDDRDTPRDESYREDLALARHSGRPAPQLFRDIRAGAESGWDFGSRWFEDGLTLATLDTTEIVPVDLNSLLFGLENAIRSGCARNKDRVCAVEFQRKAQARHAAIDRYLWNSAAGAYDDYRWTHASRIARLSAATLYPLFVALSSKVQAAAVAHTVAGELLKPGGIVTTTVDTGQQWDSPNGWAPLQWIAIAGLRSYGLDTLAKTIACRWVTNVTNVYRHTGKLVEKYNVIILGRRGAGGEYPLQDGFGWTNGVTRKLIALYPADADVKTPADCH